MTAIILPWLPFVLHNREGTKAAKFFNPYEGFIFVERSRKKGVEAYASTPPNLDFFTEIPKNPILIIITPPLGGYNYLIRVNTGE
jgi:hypothetical protein